MTFNQAAVEPTAQAIDEMADELCRRAEELRKCAKSVREEMTFDGAVEALEIASRITANCRMDLLLKRPLRATTNQKDS